MIEGPNPWALPGLGRWLDDVVRRIGHGLAVLPVDPSRPSGSLEALQERLRLHKVEIHASVGHGPAGAVADAFGTAPTLDALLNPVLDQELAIIFLSGIGPDEIAEWSVFLRRFAAARASGRAGPALLVADPPPELNAPAGALPTSWRTGLRRGDCIIWAEEHLPASREGLVGDLAVALAVELCAWRLDLAAALVQAGLDDLAEPVGWLARRTEAPMRGADPPCPLDLFAEQRSGELNRRIWKAQLGVLFPALETWRLEIVATHRSRLRIDDHLRNQGINSVEEIELGALRYQLSRSLARSDTERLDLLTRARNALAHRQALKPEDAQQLFRG